ncbi:MAG TPA: hypothetical protein PKA44_03115, partial [Saprospiraceae bacterium]|nr:hypothetical protein [Saprospiraceae bacterium]
LITSRKSILHLSNAEFGFKVLMSFFALVKNGSFGFAKGRLPKGSGQVVCRAKPNVPFGRQQILF